jgi:sugar/nucleoside kinase (ribokinase family)
MFHLGYLLLLDNLDAPNPHHGTESGKVLSKAKEMGLKTSIDVVSEQSDRFETLVLPALRFVDYCFMNEVEAEKTTGATLLTDGKLDKQAALEAAAVLFDAGVAEWVFLHAAEGAMAISPDGKFYWQGAVDMPKSGIKGTAGAGDAFAAGVLFGLHEQHPIPECLTMGVCAAATCITHPTTTGGVLKMSACLELGRQLGFQS